LLARQRRELELAGALKEIAKAPVASNSSSGSGFETTGQADLIQQINEVREETAQRFQALEERQEERQSKFERRQEERQSKLEKTSDQILHMLGQVLAQKGVA
jgi:septin family protein